MYISSNNPSKHKLKADETIFNTNYTVINSKLTA